MPISRFTDQELRAMQIGPERATKFTPSLPDKDALHAIFQRALADNPAQLAPLVDVVNNSRFLRDALAGVAPLSRPPTPYEVADAFVAFADAYADAPHALDRIGYEGPRAAAEIARLVAADATVRLHASSSADVVDAGAALGAVTRVRTRGAVLGGAALASALTYGNFDVLERIASSVKASPGGALARALGVDERDFLRTGETDETVVAARIAIALAKNGGDLAAIAARAGRPAGDALFDLAARVAAKSAPAFAPTFAPANWNGLASLVRAIGNLAPSSEARTVVDGLVRNDALLPAKIDAVEAVVDALAPDHFRDQGLVGAQHLLPTSVALYEALIRRGMAPSDIHVVGTPYGTNPLVASYLRLLGVRVAEQKDFGGDTWFSDEMRKQKLATFLDETLERSIDTPPTRGFLVLDDGGLLLAALAGKKDPVYSGALPPEARAAWRSLLAGHGVEQTRRGITEIMAHGAPIPVVNVAQAKGKDEEGKVIGKALADSLDEQLRQAGLLVDGKKPRVCVVGGGVTGERAANSLRDAGLVVVVVERDATKAARLRAAGFAVSEGVGEVARDVDVLLGCTGTMSIDARELAEFHGVIASGSSMAVEGNRAQLDLYGVYASELNELRPINFTGDGRENLSKEEIGPTRALLLIGLAQRAEKNADGSVLVPIDGKLEDRMLEAAHAAMKNAKPAKAASIERPDVTSRKATHDEWMTFLANRREAVSPPPSTTLQSPGVYFFEDGGVVRRVDTREGTSAPVRLPEVPQNTRWLTAGGETCACVVDGALVQVTPAGVKHIASDVTSMRIAPFGRDERAAIARTKSGDVVVVRAWKAATREKSDAPLDAMPIVVDDRVAFVEREAPTVTGDDALAAKTKAWRSIEGAGTQIVGGVRVNVVIGTRDDGGVAVLVGDAELTLPAGAAVMNVRVAPNQSDTAIVDWAPPNETIDAATYRSSSVALPGARRFRD